MPLYRRHRLGDTTRTTPAVFGNRSYPLARLRRRDGVENMTLFIKNVCIGVVRGAEDEEHVLGPSISGRGG